MARRSAPLQAASESSGSGYPRWRWRIRSATRCRSPYRWGDLFERRRRMLAEWARYCSIPKDRLRGKIASIRQQS